MPKLPGADTGGPSEALRKAIERTFEATVDSAAGTRERAGELVDQVVRRGRGEARRLDRELGSINGRLEQLEATIRRGVQKRKG
jgi:polyhydroxyalkanoate synthesis regulator phasin